MTDDFVSAFRDDIRAAAYRLGGETRAPHRRRPGTGALAMAVAVAAVIALVVVIGTARHHASERPAAPAKSHERVTAQVVDVDAARTSLTIDLGPSAGVRGGEAVVAGDALVGKVATVTGHTAQVSTLLDPASGTSVTIGAKDTPGTVYSDLHYPGELVIRTGERLDAVRVGDLASTGGPGLGRPPLGGVPYPSGLRVATVIRLSTAGDVAEAKPAADLGALTSVDVLLDTGTPALHKQLSLGPSGKRSVQTRYGRVQVVLRGAQVCLNIFRPGSPGSGGICGAADRAADARMGEIILDDPRKAFDQPFGAYGLVPDGVDHVIYHRHRVPVRGNVWAAPPSRGNRRVYVPGLGRSISGLTFNR